MHSTAHTFKPTDPMFLFGAGMFVLNRFSDSYINIPLADLLFPFITLFFVMKQGRLKEVIKSPGCILAIILLLTITLSNLVHGISFGGQFRNTFANFTLFIPIFFFAALKDRTSLMTYMIGTVVGFGLYFTCLVGMAFAAGDLARDLRGEQITPVVPLAYYFLFRRQLPKLVNYILLGSALVTTYMTFAIDVRACLVALVAGVGFYGMARVTPWPRIALPAAVAFGLSAHFIASFFVSSSFDTLMSSGSESISNMERAYAIDYCRMVLDQSPWFGDSPQGYSINFSDNFAYAARILSEGDQIASPHNSFLEFAVFFGYPAAGLFLLLIGWMLYAGIANKTFAKSLFVAFACAGIIRIGAFYGFSGWLRVEWFALMFALYYNYDIILRPTSARPDPFMPTVLKEHLRPKVLNPRQLPKS